MSPTQGERWRQPGVLARRDYQVKLISGRTVTLRFSLADPRHKATALVKQAHDASNLGLLLVLDDPDSAAEAVLWFQQAASLTLVSQSGDTAIGDEVQDLLPRYFAVFFDEIKDVAPELADVRLTAQRRGDRTLH